MLSASQVLPYDTTRGRQQSAFRPDDSVFADPGRFDITRSPDPHVGFGAAGGLPSSFINGIKHLPCEFAWRH